MVLDQTETLCNSSHWFYFAFKGSNFWLMDYCSLQRIYTWQSGLKWKIRRAVVSSEVTGTWTFDMNDKSRCSSKSGKPVEDFLSLGSLTMKSSHKMRPKVKSSLFGFKSTGKIILSYQTCENALFLLSSKANFKEYFVLSLAHRKAQNKSPSIVLSRVKNTKPVLIGSSMTSSDACKSPRIAHIYWNKDHIGAGFGCRPTQGIEWNINAKEIFEFIGVRSSEQHRSSKWKLAKDVCEVRYNQGTAKPATRKPNKASSSGSRSPATSNNISFSHSSNTSLNPLTIKPNKGSSSTPKSPPTTNPFNMTPGSFSSSSKTSPIPIHTPLMLTTPMHQSKANQTGNNPKGLSETPPALLNTTDGGKGNRQKSKASPIRLNISILYTSVITSIIVSPTKR